VNSELSGFDTVLYQLNAEGEEQDLSLDKESDERVDDARRKFGLGAYSATNQLSLWQSQAPTPTTASPSSAPSP
jgi:hypothetical protein